MTHIWTVRRGTRSSKQITGANNDKMSRFHRIWAPECSTKNYLLQTMYIRWCTVTFNSWVLVLINPKTKVTLTCINRTHEHGSIKCSYFLHEGRSKHFLQSGMIQCDSLSHEPCWQMLHELLFENGPRDTATNQRNKAGLNRENKARVWHTLDGNQIQSW